MAREGRGGRTRQFNPAIPHAWYVVRTVGGGTVVGHFRDSDDLPGTIVAGPFDTREEAFDAEKRYRSRGNPPATGAASLGEYVSVLRILHSEIPVDFDKARQTVLNTPPARRSEFAKEIWRRRKRSDGRGWASWSTS